MFLGILIRVRKLFARVNENRTLIALREKCLYLKFFWSLYPVFGMNIDIYSVNLCIQLECREEIQTRKTQKTDTFYAV